RICTKLRGNEMLLFFLFMLMNMVVTTSAFDCGSSVKGVKIIGCYKRSPKVFDHLLVESFLNEDMMCECAIKAQENGDIAFAVSDYQACLATKDQAGYAKILKDNTPVTHTYDCINNYFEDCRPGQQCFGNNYYEYIYELPKKQTETTTTQAPIKTTATPTQINGGWGEWTKPTPCSKSCGGGKTTRSRKCDNPAPAHGGKDCEGSDTETRECNTFECPKKPVNGGWGEWTKPTPCSKSCGGGTTTRSRKCDNPAPANGGWNCEGSGTETQKCNTNECPKQAVNGGWGEWTKPTLCSKSCGGGKTTRSRKCDNPAPAHGEKDCEGSDTETRECNAKQCAVDGGFGEWSGFGECSVTCGVGTKTRRRECDQPKPSGGGKTCQGETTQTENCDTQVNCPVDGKWAEWSEWESCDKCCGGGSQRRYRTCDNPPPGPNGKKCQGERIDSRKCNTHSCPDPKNCFFKYTQYTPLDKDGKPIFLDQHQIKCPASHVLNYIRLQKNEQETMISYGYRCCKTQACANLPKTNDETYNGGGYGKVFNLDHQTVACKNEGLSSLKLDRDMTRWNYKYDCCKLGNQKAELDCYNANSQFLSNMGGSVLSLLNQEISCKCDDYYITDFKMNRNYNGNEDQIRYDFQCCKITSAPCNTEECQVVSNGNWGEWTYWSDCSVTCANGVHKRTRKCDNPPRLGSGKDCEGEAVETKPCNTGRKCPLDGKWAEWSEWESCDKCCGGGSQRRYRTCDNPPPGPNGKKCQGERIDSRKCNTHSCPDPKNCFFKYTQYTPLDKDGKPIFLDQHQIKCPTSHVLNYIRLQKNEQETMISYGYRCCKTQACANLPKTNDETYNGGGYGKVFNLDHQTVACKNEGLSSLKLDRDMTRWNYKYDCCKLGNQKAELDCYNANSQFLSDMGGSVLSLLNQEISCKCDDYYITDFKMNRNYNGNEDQIRYDFQCCKIKN
uniref:Hemicentin-1 n=1 Tax=Clytia hemisphaerica TaxID=252671 RepID=A0A7M5WTV6_9CNID